MKTLLLGFAVIFSILTSACNRSTVLFNVIDTAAVSKADDYFDLSSKQKTELKKDLRQDLDSAKKEMLPEVALKLRSLAPEVEKPVLNSELMIAELSEFQNYIKKISRYFSRTATKFALTLSSDQVSHFAAEVREEIEDREDLEDAREDVEKRYRRSIEFWIGGISKNQREQISHFLNVHPFPTALENKSREHVLKQFIEASKTPESMTKFMEAFTTDYETVRLPAYKEALNAHKKEFQKFLVHDFWKTVDSTQKKRFKENLLNRAEELEKIAKQ